jgi:hypothetical protein
LPYEGIGDLASGGRPKGALGWCVGSRDSGLRARGGLKGSQLPCRLLILPDAAAAAAALDGAKAALGNAVTGGTPQSASVGSGGTMTSGTSPDGSKGVTVLLFTQGKAFTTLEFDGPPNELAPPDFVIDVGQKQDTAIKNGLPG